MKRKRGQVGKGGQEIPGRATPEGLLLLREGQSSFGRESGKVKGPRKSNRGAGERAQTHNFP